MEGECALHWPCLGSTSVDEPKGGKFWKDLRISTCCFTDAFGLVFFLTCMNHCYYTKYVCNDGDVKRGGAPGTR